MELGEASFRKKIHINRFIWPVLDLKIQNPRRALATAALLARYTEGERRALHVLCWSRWAFAPPAPSIIRGLPGKRWWACSTICSAPTLPIGLRPESSVLLGLGWDACASWRRAVGVIIDLQIFGAFTNEPTNLKFSKRSIIFASNSCLFVFRVQIRAMSRSRICQFAQSATSATAFILQT